MSGEIIHQHIIICGDALPTPKGVGFFEDATPNSIHAAFCLTRGRLERHEFRYDNSETEPTRVILTRGVHHRHDYREQIAWVTP